MVKQSEQIITKKTLDQSKCHPELVEGYSSLYQEVTLRQAKCDNKFLRNDEFHFERREKSVFFISSGFLSRAILRNDRTKNSKSLIIADKLYLLFFLISITLLLLNGCANQLPPGGGEVDKIPPEIIYSYPENGTVNYKGDFIELEFSEYVDKRSFKEALFISPSIDEQPEINWSGKSVEIFFPDGLRDSVTYVVTIGTDVVDVNNKNRMTSSYSFSFATGDKIDKRNVTGNVYGKDIEGALIFAYKFSFDTTNYLTKKPDYISQIGKDGSYKLNGLAESVYRIFAIKDQLRDFKYQADQDLIGIPFEDVTLIGSDSSFVGLNFFLSDIDTITPKLISAVMTDSNHILVTLSEECDTSILHANNYFIIDSTSNSKLNVEYCYKGNSKKDEFILVQTNKLNPADSYYLFAKKLLDLSDNISENDFRELIVSEKPDTTVPQIFKTNPAKNTAVDFLNPEIIFYFDDALQNKQIKDAIQFEDTLKNKIPFRLSFLDDATLVIKPIINLKPDRHYQIKLNLSKIIDASDNKTDSVYTFKFATISGIEFTGLSGKIKTNLENVVIVLQNNKTPDLSYKTKPDKTSTYNFTRIQPGSYSLWYFSDRDSTEIYDYGYPYPFRYSDEFYFVKDTVKLPPRWSVTDFDIIQK